MKKEKRKRKVSSLARSVPKPLKVPSLARSVPKPLKRERERKRKRKKKKEKKIERRNPDFRVHP